MSAFTILAALATLIGWAYRDRTPDFGSYIPEPAAAREALEAVMRAWVEGRPLDAPAATKPDVYAVDKQRKPGQKLTRFEILGEVSSERARAFAVRLVFEAPKESKVVRYIVVGVNPVWVFHPVDYESICQWTHPMDKPSDAEPAAVSEPTP